MKMNFKLTDINNEIKNKKITTRHRRVSHLSAAMTAQLVERNLVATIAISSMTQGLAAVQTTTELTCANHRTNVISIDATNLDTLMPLKDK